MILIGQREKISRDEITGMILSGEEGLRMLIKNPSEELVEFIKNNLDDEDAILMQIPRFDMPKTDFEIQVIREMRVVLKDHCEKLAEKLGKEELVEWKDFEEMYNSLEDFDYPHKDKLLDFIKYFFLDNVLDHETIVMNFGAFLDTISGKKDTTNLSDKSRNGTATISKRRKSGDSQGSYSGSMDETAKKRFLASSGVDDKFNEEEKMLDIAE